MQQVNLYQPILRKQEKTFSARTLLQGNLMVLLGLALLYGYTVVQTRNMQTQLAQVQQQRDGQIKQLAELARQFPPKAKDETLQVRIEQQQAELAHKRKLLTAVTQLGLGGDVGFSEHLSGLARQDLPQLWLKQITLRQGQQVKLTGLAYQPEVVPLYLQRLATEKAFNGTAFHSVVIARNAEQPGLVDFNLSTQVPEVKK